MQAMIKSRLHPELRELVVEASLALARLDAERLEELALSCQALNCDPAVVSHERRAGLLRQARDASPEMAVFERVVDATRGNLEVMKRVRNRRADQLEYNRPFAAGPGMCEVTEKKHGDN